MAKLTIVQFPLGNNMLPWRAMCHILLWTIILSTEFYFLHFDLQNMSCNFRTCLVTVIGKSQGKFPNRKAIYWTTKICPTINLGKNIFFPKRTSFRRDLKKIQSSLISKVCVILMSKLLIKYFAKLKNIKQENLR